MLLSISCFHAQTCTINMRRATHIQCWISNRSAAFTWNPIWKLTEMKLKKVISSSGRVYLNVYMFRNDMNSYRSRFHIGYFDRFEIQHPIWVALHIFVVQVRAWKHKIDNNTFHRFLLITKHLSDVIRNRCSQKFCNIRRKTPVLGSLFNKAAGLKMVAWRPAILLKETPTQVFAREYCKTLEQLFYRTPLVAASEKDCSLT